MRGDSILVTNWANGLWTPRDKQVEKFVAGMQKIALPADTSIDATVGIGQIPAGFGIEVQLVVSIPGMEREAAQALVDKAHAVCPYSNATRGNIEVTITVA